MAKRSGRPLPDLAALPAPAPPAAGAPRR